MTDIEQIIKAKADAIGALVEAIKGGIAAGEINDLDEVERVLSAWNDAVSEMVPSQAYAEPAKPAGAVGVTFVRRWGVGSSQPTDVTKVEDRDGDFWHKAEDGGWCNGSEGVAVGDSSWAYVVNQWGPLTEVM